MEGTTISHVRDDEGISMTFNFNKTRLKCRDEKKLEKRHKNLDAEF